MCDHTTGRGGVEYSTRTSYTPAAFVSSPIDPLMAVMNDARQAPLVGILPASLRTRTRPARHAQGIRSRAKSGRVGSGDVSVIKIAGALVGTDRVTLPINPHVSNL